MATRLVKGSYIQYSDERGSVLLINFRRVLRSHRAPPKYVLRSVIGTVRAGSRFHHGPECHSKKTGCRVVILSSKGVGVGAHCPRQQREKRDARCLIKVVLDGNRRLEKPWSSSLWCFVWSLLPTYSIRYQICQFVLRFAYVSAFQVPPSYVSSLRHLYPSCHLLVVLI